MHSYRDGWTTRHRGERELASETQSGGYRSLLYTAHTDERKWVLFAEMDLEYISLHDRSRVVIFPVGARITVRVRSCEDLKIHALQRDHPGTQTPRATRLY